MTAADQLRRIAPYVGRLLEDEYTQEQIIRALTGLRQSSRRARGQTASEALKDRRLRKHVRDAVSSLTTASRALNGSARPKRHFFRTALLLTLAGAVGALAWQRRSTSGVR
jgi:hypothetical protein